MGSRKKARAPTLRKVGAKKELFHIRRSGQGRTYTIQVPAEVKSLNSMDSFILKTPEKIWLWYGAKTSFEDSAVTREVCDRLNKSSGNPREIVVQEDGKEDTQFWNNLGGWADFDCNTIFAAKYGPHPPRLFEFSHISGMLKAVEVNGFYQTDLNEVDVFLCDTWHEVYIWVGKRASESLFRQVLDFANNYVRKMAEQRMIYVPLKTAEAGEEPEEFTRHFHTWVRVEKKTVDPLELRAELLADERFREYKLKEQEERKKKEERKKAALMAREADGGQGDGLKRIDWVLVIINEMPELVESGLSDSEEIEAGDDDLGAENLDDNYGPDEGEDDLGDEGSDSEKEITMEEVEGKTQLRGDNNYGPDEGEDGGYGEENSHSEDHESSEEEVMYGEGD